MKKTVYIFILLFVSINIFGQSNDEKAKATYLKANEEFDNGSYQSCITKLEEAKSLLGNSNARIQYLLSKSYFQLDNFKQTKIELQKYFDYNPKVNDLYKEMTELTEKVDKKLAEGKEHGSTKGDVISDSRDNNIYQTIIIGNQTWMAKNLNYKTDYGSWPYDNQDKNSSDYGRLYLWEVAKDACPTGWELPSKKDWESLFDNIGGIDKAVQILHNNGFNLVFGGYSEVTKNNNLFSTKKFIGIGSQALYWSSDAYTANHDWYYTHFLSNTYFSNSNANAIITYSSEGAFSVRCIKKK